VAPEEAANTRKPSKWEASTTRLGLLNHQRATSDAAMWQAPVIMIAAQAFLLQIVADERIDWWARLIVLVAG
jgi:hypothetical protein